MDPIKRLIYIAAASVLMLASCSKEAVQTEGPLTISTSVEPFVCEDGTKANLAGTGFEAGDWLRIKVICPYASETQNGESTNSASFYGYWLMKCTGDGSWSTLSSKDGCDINGDYVNSGSSSLTGQLLVQNTPYVFTASTWSSEKSFVVGKSLYLHYAPMFRADQRLEKSYRDNDILWGQSYSQTGPVHLSLSFAHVMSSLVIDVAGIDLTGKEALLSLEGMPDIDQQEIVIGNYYASKDKYGTAYGPKDMEVCEKAQNGKVLGIGVINETSNIKKAVTTPFSSFANTGVYHAYKAGANRFMMIVPPCNLGAGNEPVFTLRVGDENSGKRYRMTLQKTEFLQGYQYSVKFKYE